MVIVCFSLSLANNICSNYKRSNSSNFWCIMFKITKIPICSICVYIYIHSSGQHVAEKDSVLRGLANAVLCLVSAEEGLVALVDVESIPCVSLV